MTYHDPIQQAADEAGGCEGLRLKHNLKEGVVYLGGAVAPADLKVLMLMPEASHGWLKFNDDQELVETDVRRYADIAPDRGERREDWSPNTSCVGVIMPDGHEIVTYFGASWGVRRAFQTALIKPFARMRQTMLPIVALGFEPQKDNFGNHRPTFAVVGWRPRGDFAQALGEAPPTAAAIEAPARPASTIVTSGLARLQAARWPSETPPPSAPPPQFDDERAGFDPRDEIPF